MLFFRFECVDSLNHYAAYWFPLTSIDNTIRGDIYRIEVTGRPIEVCPCIMTSYKTYGYTADRRTIERSC